MRQIESLADEARKVETYELPDGRYVSFDKRHVDEYGLEACMRHAGIDYEAPTGRLPVLHHGSMIGTLPATFDERRVRSQSWLYDPRPGDFRREGQNIIADRMLGPGDIEAVEGFQPA